MTFELISHDRFLDILYILLLFGSTHVLVEGLNLHPKVSTKEGIVKGEVIFAKRLLHSFRSVPFAKPPIDDLRFRNPKPFGSWDGVLDVTKRRSICPQVNTIGKAHLGDEDCLYLQITTPADALAKKDPLPVLFWIFGGAFVIGDYSQEGFYDPTSLVSNHDVIIVQANYRLNIFGFLAHERLKNDHDNNEGSSTGNMGIMDQRLALEWVQRNVEHFGGDPRRVTIFGESAGAMSVCHHYSNPNFPGLFHAAIMQSGSCDSREFFLDLEKAMSFGSTFSNMIGCKNDEGYISCMQSKTTGEIMRGVSKAVRRNERRLYSTKNNIFSNPNDSNSTLVPLPVFAPLANFAPVVDGTNIGLPDIPLESIKQGNFNNVPLILGSNQDEGTIFVPMISTVVDDTHYPLRKSDISNVVHHLLDPLIGQDTVNKIYNELLSLYDEEKTGTPSNQIAKIFRDYMFLCPTRRVARVLSSSSPQQRNETPAAVYAYHFDYQNLWPDFITFGTYHVSDIYFVWGNEYPYPLHRFSMRDKKISNIFQTFWTNMAITGNPNNNEYCVDDECLEWPQFQRFNGTEAILKISLPVSIVTEIEHDKCDFWDYINEL